MVDDSNEWYEGLAILIAVVVVVLVTAINDWKKEKQFRKLQTNLENERLFATVHDGELYQVPIRQLLVGDISLVKYSTTRYSIEMNVEIRFYIILR